MRARLEFLAFAGSALLFVVLSPVFWYSVELPETGAAPPMAAQPGLLETLLPKARFAAAQLRDGQVPLWSPDIQLGVPFHALPANAVFSPMRVLDLALEPQAVMAAQAFVHILLAALAMLLFLRTLEVSWAGALPGASAYAFSGTMAGAMSLPGIGATYAIGPLLFWGVYQTVSRGERGGVWVSALAMGICMLSGSLDRPLTLWALAVVWGGLLCPFLRGGPRWRRWMLWSAGTFTLSLTAAAAQWVPSLQWASGLSRPWELFASAAVPGATPAGPLAMVVHLLEPVASPVPPLGFLGALGILFTAPALVGRKRRAEALTLGVLWAALLAGTALDLGRDVSGLNAGLFLFLLPLPGACLAGIGAGRVLAVGKDPRVREVWLPTLVCVLAWAGLLALSGAQARGWLIAAGCALLAPMLVRWKLLANAAGLALALLLFVELATTSTDYYGHPFFNPEVGTVPPAPLWQRASELALDGRVLLLTEDAATLAMQAEAAGVRTLGGNNLPLPRALDGWWQAAGADLAKPPAMDVLNTNPALLACLRALDVRAAIVKQSAPPASGPTVGFRTADTFPPYTLYALDSPGRVHWTPRWKSVPGYVAALTRLTAPGFDPASECVLESFGWPGETPPPAPSLDTPVSPGGAQWRINRYSATALEVSVTAPSPGALTVSAQIAPGWRAYIDDAPAPLYRANRVMRGVVVPAGTHRVSFEYRPWPSYAGAAASVATFGFMILAMLLEVFRRRPSL